MRWTRQRFARDGIAGRVERFVSDQQHADERCCCGRPIRVVLTPRRWRQVCGRQVGPTGRGQAAHSASDGGKRARSPGRARHKPLKPLRAGMPGGSGVLVVARVRSTNTKCTRGCGCSGHPAFPTPSKGAREKCKPRAHRAARSRSCIWTLFLPFEAKRVWVRSASFLAPQNAPVMPGLDPGIHQSSRKVFRRRWITGSSPVMTISMGMTVIVRSDLSAVAQRAKAEATKQSVTRSASDGIEKPPMHFLITTEHKFGRERTIATI
jgi:hypothetical protein